MRVTKKTHKYGIKIPTSVDHAYKIDKKNKDKFWRYAISKEMHRIVIDFKILDLNCHVTLVRKKVTGRIVFKVKMDLTRKAHWVLDGHITPNPEVSLYAGVVLRESIRIALMYTTLNRLDVIAAGIRNTYLQATSSQKDYIICGPDFGLENFGKKALIRRELY